MCAWRGRGCRQVGQVRARRGTEKRERETDLHLSCLFHLVRRRRRRENRIKEEKKKLVFPLKTEEEEEEQEEEEELFRYKYLIILRSLLQ